MTDKMKRPESNEEYAQVWAECMGTGELTRCPEKACNDPGHCLYSKDLDMWFKDELDPVNNMNQCMMLVEKMRDEKWEVTTQSKKHSWCHLGRNSSHDWRDAELHQASADTLQKAIILACAEALGILEAKR